MAESRASERERLKKTLPHQHHPIPLRKGPSCPDPGTFVESKHPSTEAPGAGASLGPGGGGTCAAGARWGAERLRGRTPREAAVRGRPRPCPARLCAPRGARSPVLVPGSCRCCQQKPRSKWMRGKLCPNLPVFGLFSAFLVCFLGSQWLILVALFR